MTESFPDPGLLEFPCDYEFKAFGPNGPAFFGQVKAAVESVVPVSLDAMKTRQSSKGTYQSVTVLVRLLSFQQLTEIYGALRAVEGLKYLL